MAERGIRNPLPDTFQRFKTRNLSRRRSLLHGDPEQREALRGRFPESLGCRAGYRVQPTGLPDEDNVQTTLVKGSVIMQSARFKQEVKLVPGEQGTLEVKTGKLSKQEVNTYLYTAWKDGRFAFRDARLEDLFNILSRWYDLQVFYLNPEAKDIRFTGDINKTEDFNAILKIIENNERVIFNVNKRTVSVQLK